MSSIDPILSTRLEEIRLNAGSLVAQIDDLAKALARALEEMERLRQRATSAQRRLVELNAQDLESMGYAAELGRLLRRFQEVGRQLETVAEPLHLTAGQLSTAIQEAQRRLGDIVSPNS